MSLCELPAAVKFPCCLNSKRHCKLAALSWSAIAANASSPDALCEWHCTPFFFLELAACSKQLLKFLPVTRVCCLQTQSFSCEQVPTYHHIFHGILGRCACTCVLPLQNSNLNILTQKIVCLSQVMDPATTPGEKLRFTFAPLLQPLLAFLVVTIAAHAAAVLAAIIAALAYSPNAALALAPLVYTAFGAAQVTHLLMR